MSKHAGGVAGHFEWCPICERPQTTLNKLAKHMKESHRRLILDRDINQQTEARAARLRAAEALEEALLA